MELRQRALEVFCIADPKHKADSAMAMAMAMAITLEITQPDTLDCQRAFDYAGQPGRPNKPQLVHPQHVPRRSPFSPEGHSALLHSIAHIEFNAINLALDAIWRFAGMPAAYYLDWLQVAHEEAKHFTMLRRHLLDEGHDYGDFLAHDGMWNICESTRHDVTTRMALVPRTMEARGLDATPIIQAKLRKVGTPRALAAVDILAIILTEEVGHVAIGNHWYHWLCQREGLDPMAFYAEVATLHGAPRLKPPFNLVARKLAGFSDVEIAALPQ